MGKSRAIEKKNHFFLLSIAIPLIKFNCPRIVKKTEILSSDSNIIYYMLYNNFIYTQLTFVFVPLNWKIFITTTIILTLFFFFSFRKMLISFTGLPLLFVFSFFRKILISFTCFFFPSFSLFFFNNIYLTFLYIQKS